MCYTMVYIWKHLLITDKSYIENNSTSIKFKSTIYELQRHENHTNY